jgi:hypothetical protein
MVPRNITDTTPVLVQLGERNFLIPANYFKRPYSERSRREQTALIYAYWPEMSGATKETSVYRKEYGGNAKRVSILINGRPVNVDPTIRRLGSYKTFLGFKDRRYGMPQERHGLVFHKDIKEYKKFGIPQDIYVDNAERPLTMITCTGIDDKKVPSPGCSQYFDYGKLRIQINYSRDYLPEWKVVQSKVKQLLDRFAQDYVDVHPSSN